MNEPIDIWVNDRRVTAQAGESVLAVLQRVGIHSIRRDVAQAAHVALCGMGVCQECAVTINGDVGQLACMRRCHLGMRVRCDV